MPLLQTWYAFSGPAEPPANAQFHIREQVRRSRIASLLILGTLCTSVLLILVVLLAAPRIFVLSRVIASTIGGILCCAFSILLNRHRQVQWVGILLIIGVDMIVGGVVLSEQGGLDPLFLSMFDLLAVSELIAASLLAPASTFAVAAINLLFVVIDIGFQQHSMMWGQMIQSEQILYSLLLRPTILYFVIASVAYLWVRNALKALERAERAELIAELEKQKQEQQQRLEQEIKQILEIHVRVANGDIDARAPIYRDYMLSQVSVALNNLLSRYKSALHSEKRLQTITNEIPYLRQALRVRRSGQPLQWYPEKESMLYPLAEDIQYVLSAEFAHRSAALQSTTPQQNLASRQRRPTSLPGITPLQNSAPNRYGAYDNNDKITPLPDNSGFFTKRQMPQIPETPNTSHIQRPQQASSIDEEQI